MTLNEYLEKHRLSVRAFAARASIGHLVVWRLLAGKSKRLSLEHAVAIVEATGFAVTFRELLQCLNKNREEQANEKAETTVDTRAGEVVH